MARSRQSKEQIVADLSENLKKSKSVVFSTYHGLTVADTQQLRRKLREGGVHHLVSKKTLMKIAFQKASQPDIDFDQFEGAIAVSIGLNDEVAPAKILAQFGKDHKQVQLLGGVLENRYIDAEGVKSLSIIPSREELLAKMVGSLASPLRGFVTVLQGNLRGLVTVLKAISEQKS